MLSGGESTYHLLCFDCWQYLSLGKVYCVFKGGEQHEWRMQGVFNEERRSWVSREQLFGRAVEGFLIRHRNHEIRFVPEGVDELLDTPISCVGALDVEEVVAPSAAIDVDADGELQEWASRLAK